MRIVPLYFWQVKKFIEEHHRHHEPPQGHLFSLALADENDVIVGVAVVGRPTARLEQLTTVEVTRLCTDGHRNACSKLYSVCARIAKEMGYKKIQTFILEEETGVSLKASGWEFVWKTSGGSRNRTSRKREDKYPTTPKLKYEKILNP